MCNDPPYPVRTPEMAQAEIRTYKDTTRATFAEMERSGPFPGLPAGTQSAIYNSEKAFFPYTHRRTFNIVSDYRFKYSHTKIRSNDPISAATTIADAFYSGKISQQWVDLFFDELCRLLPDPCELIPLANIGGK